LIGLATQRNGLVGAMDVKDQTGPIPCRHALMPTDMPQDKNSVLKIKNRKNFAVKFISCNRQNPVKIHKVLKLSKRWQDQSMQQLIRRAPPQIIHTEGLTERKQNVGVVVFATKLPLIALKCIAQKQYVIAKVM